MSHGDLIKQYPALSDPVPTGGDAPPQPRGLQIIHAHAMVTEATQRRDQLLAEAQERGVPLRALALLVGVGFTTVGRWIKLHREAA